MRYYEQSMRLNLKTDDRDARRKNRILVGICFVLVLVCAVLTTLVIRDGTYRTETQMQITKQMQESISNAVSEVSRMAGMGASDSQAQLARVRQYIYHMDELNKMSMELAGGESGRMVSSAALNTIFQDLNEFETVLQGNKNSTMDIRTKLESHLKTLQTILIGQ